MEKFEALEKAMCNELEALEKKFNGSAEMSVQDLDKIDKLTHAMKCLATYVAMKESESYRYDDGMSGRRGRYISRDDGWSGHYPPMYYPPDRRW